MRLVETRCSWCEDDVSQCDSCREFDLRTDFDKKCKNSNYQYNEKDCEMKDITCKLEACAKCNYTFTYP